MVFSEIVKSWPNAFHISLDKARRKSSNVDQCWEDVANTTWLFVICLGVRKIVEFFWIDKMFNCKSKGSYSAKILICKVEQKVEHLSKCSWQCSTTPSSEFAWHRKFWPLSNFARQLSTRQENAQQGRKTLSTFHFKKSQVFSSEKTLFHLESGTENDILTQNACNLHWWSLPMVVNCFGIYENTSLRLKYLQVAINTFPYDWSGMSGLHRKHVTGNSEVLFLIL